MPFNKYFAYFNITFDELKEEIEDIKNNRKADFIIHYKEDDMPGYRLVMGGNMPTYNVDVGRLRANEEVSFYLYEKIDN